MQAFIIRRLLQFIPTILVITLIMFILLNILPGNAALMSMDARQAADANYVRQLKAEMGLDKPIHIRYLNYIKNLAMGDLGLSYIHREKVNHLIMDRLWPTIKLAVVAMAIAAALGIPLGFLSAIKQGTWLDSFFMISAISGVSVPQFWLGLMLMYFLSVQLRLLPTFGYGDGAIANLVLPATALGIGYMALIARTTRAAVVEILNADFVRTARSKGLNENEVLFKHVFRNAFILILTTVGLQFGSMIGHTVIIEKLFSWPGIGSLLVDSIFKRDLPITQGCVLLIVILFLVVNLVIDILYSVIYPRIVHT